MANAKNTGSTLTTDLGKNKTSTGISTHIVIKVNNITVGAVKSLQIKESRSVKQIDEVGTDGHIDSVPTSSTNISGSCTRVRFDRLRIAEAFGRGFIHVASQAYPFDIVILDRQKRNEGSQISTIIKNVWITDIDFTYSSDDWIITEQMNWVAETISSHLNGGKSVANGGERQLEYSKVSLEQETDSGANGRRGSLDTEGLIDLGDTYSDIF
tara:strand:- start:2939 stop:3574 length:636 start_codon:yes stop_codon:yes gene_type:complete